MFSWFGPWAKIRVFLKGCLGGVATIELKRQMIRTCILGIAVYKLGHRQVPSSIILLPIDKHVEVHFHCDVLSIGLAAGSLVKSDEEFSFNSQKITEWGLELDHENWPSVTNYQVLRTMVLHHHVYDHFHKTQRINGNLNWLVIHHFCKWVDNDEYRVEAVALLISENR